MADLNITAPVMGSPTGGSKTAASAIAAGELIYAVSSNTVSPADADNLATANVLGMALRAASTDGYVVYARDGDRVDVGVATASGETYVLSPAAGNMMPVADLASGNYVTYCAFGLGGTAVEMHIKATGVTVP